MGVIDEIDRLRKDLFALELQEVSARIEAFERNNAASDDSAVQASAERHKETMRAIASLADTTGLWERLVRIEAREKAN
jgi:hypothetical protein